MQMPEEKLNAIRDALYDEWNMYDLSIRPMGMLWDHSWLYGYAQDDRSASMLGDFLTIVSKNLQETATLTAAAKEYIPAMNKELATIRRLDDEMIAPVKRTYDKVLTRFENEHRYVLLPGEYSDVSYRIGSAIMYLDYRNGLNVLMKNHFDGGDTRELLEFYGPKAWAFTNKWDTHFYIGDSKEFGFITFLGVDSHDDSNNSPIIPKVLKASNPTGVTDVLLNERPWRGIERVIFADEQRIVGGIRDILENREQKTKMCTVNSFRMRLHKAEMARHLRNVVPKPKKKNGEETTPPKLSYVR